MNTLKVISETNYDPKFLTRYEANEQMKAVLMGILQVTLGIPKFPTSLYDPGVHVLTIRSGL
jgi:hypothetical protein